MASAWSYLPILKWKQGERIALRELTMAQWDGIVPLLELPAISAAPDVESLRAALPNYTQKIAGHLAKAIPEAKPVAIDVRWVAPSYTKQARLLLVICRLLAKQSERKIIPAISELMLVNDVVDLAKLVEFDPIAIRISVRDVDAIQIAPLVAAATKEGLTKKRLHLVLDQYSIVRGDPKAIFTTVRPHIDAALSIGCGSVTLAGGSFPVDLIGYKQGAHDIPRVQWRIWEMAKAKRDYEKLLYSDYAVTNPGPLPDLDPRQVNPSVAIRYAADGFWRLYKAGGFKRGAPNQYRGLCNLLLLDKIYSSATFSYGDQCYDEAARGSKGNGNPSSWRRDATSHHLVFTKSQL